MNYSIEIEITTTLEGRKAVATARVQGDIVNIYEMEFKNTAEHYWDKDSVAREMSIFVAEQAF